MKIVYRISPFKPDNPSVYYPDDKWKLVQMCHNSFLNAGGSNYETTYVVDSCDWGKLFKGKIIEINSHNKNSSLLAAYDSAMGMDDDILFVEDDYLWVPDTIPLMEVALKTLPVLSPYDHPAHYIEDRFDKRYEMKLIGNHTYRTCPSNTHTFAIQKDVLKENIEMMRKWGVSDHQMFTELNKTAQIWCPVPSFATHLANGCLAPNVEWNKLANL